MLSRVKLEKEHLSLGFLKWQILSWFSKVTMKKKQNKYVKWLLKKMEAVYFEIGINCIGYLLKANNYY